jgi:hypothetical protein
MVHGMEGQSKALSGESQRSLQWRTSIEWLKLMKELYKTLASSEPKEFKLRQLTIRQVAS